MIATLNIDITHAAGPPIVNDDNHVLAWICADGQFLDGIMCGFTFEVCPDHRDPDECDCTDLASTYKAMIVAASPDA